MSKYSDNKLRIQKNKNVLPKYLLNKNNQGNNQDNLSYGQLLYDSDWISLESTSDSYDRYDKANPLAFNYILNADLSKINKKVSDLNKENLNFIIEMKNVDGSIELIKELKSQSISYDSSGGKLLADDLLLYSGDILTNIMEQEVADESNVLYQKPLNQFIWNGNERGYVLTAYIQGYTKYEEAGSNANTIFYNTMKVEGYIKYVTSLSSTGISGQGNFYWTEGTSDINEEDQWETTYEYSTTHSESLPFENFTDEDGNVDYTLSISIYDPTESFNKYKTYSIPYGDSLSLDGTDYIQPTYDSDYHYEILNSSNQLTFPGITIPPEDGHTPTLYNASYLYFYPSGEIRNIDYYDIFTVADHSYNNIVYVSTSEDEKINITGRIIKNPSSYTEETETIEYDKEIYKRVETDTSVTYPYDSTETTEITIPFTNKTPVDENIEIRCRIVHIDEGSINYLREKND